MKRSLASLLLFAAPAFAQSFVPFQAGTLSCGIVERASNQVQIYCRDANFALIYNTIQNIGKTTAYPGTQIIYTNGDDNLNVRLNLQSNIIYYEINTNTNAYTGILTAIYGAVGLGCSVNQPGAVSFHWKMDSKTCITAWADAWLDCCAGN